MTEPLNVERGFRRAKDSRPDAPSPWPILGARVDGEPTTIEEARTAGLPALEPAGHPDLASAIHFRSGRHLVTYLSREPLSDEDTFVDLYADGGAFLSEGPFQGEPMVALMRDRLGDEGADVQVGAFDGLLLHGDELAAGVRPFSLFWSDGSTDWILTAGFDDPSAVVGLARSVVC